MIKRIKKLKNFGIFHDYSHKAPAPDFKRFNLIYGWNGSGKTTISRLLSSLENGESAFFPDAEYQLEFESGTIAKQKVPYTENKIMVFNQDYIAENAPSLSDPDAKSKHIYLLGKEDKELAKQIETDKKELQALNESEDPKKKSSLTYRKQLLEKTQLTLFKTTADTIASIKGGTAIRTYNRNHAIAVYDKLGQKEELSKNELETTHKLVDQQILDDINGLSISSVTVQLKNSNETYTVEEFLAKLKGSVTNTLNETVQQILIDRIKDNEDIAEWVAQGMVIHKSHKSSTCEYCNQTIPKSRLDDMSKHFNDAYAKLVSGIDAQIKSLELTIQRIEQLELINKAVLYPQFIDEYEKLRISTEEKRRVAIANIKSAISSLEKKKLTTHKQTIFADELSIKELLGDVGSISDLISKHNAHTKSFKSSVDDAREKLAKHYVSKIYDQVKEMDTEMVTLGDEISMVETRKIELKTKIEEAEASIRNSKEACADINKCLLGIIGRDEIVFEDHEDGYLIKRNGVSASNLSEGEKTAIAFVYFVIHLSNKDFDLAQGILVIDDPISSLDVEGIFRVCTLMDTKLKKAKQIIILTHNFDFFNQIKKWFMNDPSINNKDDHKDDQGEYFMVKNRYDTVSKQRVAYIDGIDPLLRDYESEYHYLFKKLVDFEGDTVTGTEGTIEAVYHYPNLARKVLECFLSFRVPMKGTMYKRMLGMSKINKAMSTTDIKEVYDFINSNSHLDTKTGLIQFDPTLGANGKKYIEKTLKLIEDCDEKHYKSMLKLVE